MKSNTFIILIIITAISLTAFGLIGMEQTAMNCNPDPEIKEIVEFDSGLKIPTLAIPEEEFLITVESRFMRTITKKELLELRSIRPLVGKMENSSPMPFHHVEVAVFNDNEENDPIAIGQKESFNETQLSLLRSLDYSANIVIRAGHRSHGEHGDDVVFYSTPHITIVPETQAQYLDGSESLISFMRENSYRQTRMTKKSELDPGKIYFTVTRDGTISNVDLLSSSGYSMVDFKMMELISKLPGRWESAKNEFGEPVDQELVLFFGNMGC